MNKWNDAELGFMVSIGKGEVIPSLLSCVGKIQDARSAFGRLFCLIALI